MVVGNQHMNFVTVEKIVYLNDNIKVSYEIKPIRHAQMNIDHFGKVFMAN